MRPADFLSVELEKRTGLSRTDLVAVAVFWSKVTPTAEEAMALFWDIRVPEDATLVSVEPLRAMVLPRKVDRLRREDFASIDQYYEERERLLAHDEIPALPAAVEDELLERLTTLERAWRTAYEPDGEIAAETAVISEPLSVARAIALRRREGGYSEEVQDALTRALQVAESAWASAEWREYRAKTGGKIPLFLASAWMASAIAAIELSRARYREGQYYEMLRLLAGSINWLEAAREAIFNMTTNATASRHPGTAAVLGVRHRGVT